MMSYVCKDDTTQPPYTEHVFFKLLFLYSDLLYMMRATPTPVLLISYI